MALRRNPQAYNSKFQEKTLEVTNVLLDELDSINHERERITTLHRYQIEACLATKRYLAMNGTRAQPVLIVAPTGSGKTGIAVLLPYILASEKVFVLSPYPHISDQLAEAYGIRGHIRSFFHKVNLTETAEDFRDFVQPIYKIGPTNMVADMGLHNLVIANAQKFGGNSKTSLFSDDEEVVRGIKTSLASFTTILVDEAHHYPARTWKEIVNNFENKQIIFLTATPFYQNKPILENQQITFEIRRNMIEGVTIRRSEFEELAFDIRNGWNEASWGQIGLRITAILNEHDGIQPGIRHKALVLVSGKDAAEAAAHFMNEATYFTSDTDTQGNFDAFQRGGVRIMAVCGKLLEGYDNNTVSVCVILLKVKARNFFTQFVGRCLRRSSQDDRVTAVVLSHRIFEQRRMWDEYDEVAEEDPVIEEE